MENYPAPARAIVADLAAKAAADPARAVAYQGAPGANSHLAALGYAPDCVPLPCFAFEDAIDAVRNGQADRAIIPIENSLHGRVADMHFLLPESGLSIVDEYFLRIRHCLMAPDATPVRSAVSHVQALGQ
ncbi:MAG: prephenate dehydratase domain-containing protein, partial [Pseudomonadota bacterium]|nr:prephenate dehydratase domain-containing protein [Pseudomonadota bacterium]